MIKRPYNFGAGPAALPEAILLDVQKELWDWQGQGMSIMEVGHRTPQFTALMDEAELDLRALLQIPDHYHVLFLGGAARTQFAMIPMNLLEANQQAGYLVSGVWSKMAYEEAHKLASAFCLASGEPHGFTKAPDHAPTSLPKNTAYVYYTPNETVNGVRFPHVPQVGDIPLIADMTSCLLSEPLTISDYGLIFAGAQKNIAPAGLTVVIVRADLLAQITHASLPTMLDYRTHVAHRSLYATPPVFNCYFAAKMFQWIKAQGGLQVMQELNRNKANKLYAYIDTSSFYHCAIDPSSRSWMNVCFSLKRPDLEPLFLSEAEAQGLCALKGHRLVGGLRASLYNAMPMAGVDALISFMDSFYRKNCG